LLTVQKKGQVTVFLIIGIILLVVSAFAFYMFSDNVKEELEVTKEKTVSLDGIKPAVKSYVEKCMVDITIEGSYLVAVNGGLIYVEDSPILLTDYGMLNYGHLAGVNYLNKDKLEEDLEIYVEKFIDECFEDFSVFQNQGYSFLVGYDNIDVKLSVSKEKINVELSLPIIISQTDGLEISLSSFSTMVDSELGGLFEAARTFSEENIEEPNLQEMNTGQYFSAVFPFDEHTTIYSLTNEDDPDALVFMFAVEHEKNTAPQLRFVPDISLRIGEKWEGQLIADDEDGDILTFLSDSAIFPVDDDGSYSAVINQLGKHVITLSVEDEDGLSGSQEVKITVLEDHGDEPLFEEEDLTNAEIESLFSDNFEGGVVDE